MSQRAQDAKYKILQAAMKRFALHGYDGTSVKEICNEAGMNVSLVSYYFGGKENVLLELFETYFLPAYSMTEMEVAEVEGDPVAALKLHIQKIMRFRFENPAMMTIVHREILNQTDRTDKIKRYIAPQWGYVREVLQEGKAKGSFEFRSLDRAFQLVQAAMIFPRINPLFMEPVLTERNNSLEEMTADTTDFILKGLRYQGD